MKCLLRWLGSCFWLLISLFHLLSLDVFHLRSDKTCKLWSAENGDLHHTYRGHSTEIVCLSFNPHGTMVATGSMDNTARLWDVETGECLHTLLGHTAEVRPDKPGDQSLPVCALTYRVVGMQSGWGGKSCLNTSCWVVCPRA